MDSASEWCSLVDVLIFDPQTERFLVEQGEHAWHIPRLAIKQLWKVPLHTINQTVFETYGVVTTILMLLRQDIDATSHTIKSLRLLETHRCNDLHPANCCWVTIQELQPSMFVNDLHATTAQAFLATLNPASIPLQRVAWARLGWYQQWEQWIRGVLSTLGQQSNGIIEQVKTWNLSFVARISTDQGWIYCKTAIQTLLMLAENRLLAYLAERLPEYVPSPLLAPNASNYLLLADLGSDQSAMASVALRAEILATFAKVQQASLNFIADLGALGCVQRDICAMMHSIPLFADDALVIEQLGSELHQRFVDQLDALFKRCELVQTYHIPTTLGHGDLHVRNVAKQRNGYYFFDWVGASLTHPFFDLQDFFHEPDPALKQQLAERYLAQWLEYEPIERLQDLLVLIEPLYAMHQALTYQALLHVLEPDARLEFAWALPFWVNQVLAGLAC